MYCFDFIKGQEIWKFPTGNSIVSTPQFGQDDSTITFGSYDEYVYCLRVEVRCHQSRTIIQIKN